MKFLNNNFLWLWINQLLCGPGTALQFLLISLSFWGKCLLVSVFLLLSVFIALCPEAGWILVSCFFSVKLVYEFAVENILTMLQIINLRQWLVIWFLHTVSCCERHFEGPGKQKRPYCCYMCRWVNKTACFVQHLDILKGHAERFQSEKSVFLYFNSSDLYYTCTNKHLNFL